jgi:WD40 repeat protein
MPRTFACAVHASSVVTACSDSTLRGFSLDGEQKVARGPRRDGAHGDAEALRVVFDESGRTLASGGSEGSVSLWPCELDKELARIQCSENEVYALLLNSNEVTAGFDNCVARYNADTLEQVWRREFAACTGNVYGGARNASGQSFVFDLAASPSAQDLLAVALSDGSVRVVTPSGSVATLDAQASFAASCRFSECGTKLVSSGGEGVSVLWDARTWKRLGGFRSKAALFGARFFRDDVVLSYGDNFVDAWDLQGQLVWRHTYQPDFPVYCVEQLRGALLVCGGRDGTAVGEHASCGGEAGRQHDGHRVHDADGHGHAHSHTKHQAHQDHGGFFVVHKPERNLVCTVHDAGGFVGYM